MTVHRLVLLYTDPRRGSEYLFRVHGVLYYFDCRPYFVFGRDPVGHWSSGTKVERRRDRLEEVTTLSWLMGKTDSTKNCFLFRSVLNKNLNKTGRTVCFKIIRRKVRVEFTVEEVLLGI